ncbi:hypothetical protein Tco_0938167 [Tanacetum coccineum]|uniref:Uncharacterized protein n=1 Tax=Tanacetum coccineum TaxID=301880 RepID=A0ABQ5DHB0_9ASTR
MLLMHTGLAIHMMIEKKYPLTQEMLSRMLSRRLEVDQESKMAFELLRFVKLRVKASKDVNKLVLSTYVTTVWFVMFIDKGSSMLMLFQVDWMLLNLIKNLYVPFGIPFDPKRYYKDGVYTRMLRRPRYHGLEYSNWDIADFEERLERIHDRDTHKVQVLDFKGMTKLIRDVLYARMLMEHRDDDGVVFEGTKRHVSWREFILALGLHTGEEMESPGFARTSPSYTSIRDPVLRLCHRMIAHNIAGRSQTPEKFVARLAEHFGLLAEERLQGLTVTAPTLLLIDMTKLLRLQICVELGDIWAWALVAPGGGDEDEEMPQAMSPPPRTQGERISQLEKVLHGMHEVLHCQREVLDSMARDFIRFTTWTVTSLSRMMDRAGVSQSDDSRAEKLTFGGASSDNMEI